LSGRKISRAMRILGFVSPVLFTAQFLLASGHVNSQLPWHEALLDTGGRLLAWYKPQKNLGYDKVMRLAWDLIEHRIPEEAPQGAPLKTYLIHTLFDPRTLRGTNWWQHTCRVLRAFTSLGSM
jgi:hypothetical protein